MFRINYTITHLLNNTSACVSLPLVFMPNMTAQKRCACDSKYNHHNSSYRHEQDGNVFVASMNVLHLSEFITLT